MHKGLNLLKIIILKEKKYSSNFLLHFLLCFFVKKYTCTIT